MKFIFDPRRLDDIATRESERYQMAAPFPHIVIDDFIEEKAAQAILENFPRAEDDAGWDRYAAAGFEMKLSSSNEEKLPAPICMAMHQLNSGPFVDFLEKLTGIEHLLPDPHLFGGGAHLVGRGGHLGVHADFNWHPRLHAHRRINLLLYFNRDWRDAWQGDLELWATDASHRVASIAPLFNRAVIFNTRSDTFHGHPRPLEIPEGEYRRSLAMYYYSAERPEAELMAPHNTRYKGYHVD